MNLNRSYKIVLAALFAAQNFLAAAQTTNAVAPSDYPKFIAQRNIFDPTREPNTPYIPRTRTTFAPPVVRQTESFSLVGVIGYGEGRLAGVYVFFDGTDPEYRKTAQLNDSIANFKIVGIAADSVTLLSDTNNRTVLKIGGQLHNDGVGHWLSDSGTAARYSNVGNYGSGRNSGRGGFASGNGNGNGYRRRNNNFGNGNSGNRNFGNNNFNSTANNNVGSAAADDNSQANDQSMNSQDDNTAPDANAAPDDNMVSPDNNADNAAPDANTQDNVAPQTDQPAEATTPAADTDDPRAALKAARAAELQQIGH